MKSDGFGECKSVSRTLQLTLKLGVLSPGYVMKYSLDSYACIKARGIVGLPSKFMAIIVFAVSSASEPTKGAVTENQSTLMRNYRGRGGITESDISIFVIKGSCKNI